MRIVACTIGLLFSTVAAPALAQDERDFCADRPGKGTPPCVLDQGRLQMELGLLDLSRQTQADTRTETWDAGDLLVRYGLDSLTELQLGLAVWNRQQVTDRTTGARDTSQGAGDLSVGLRRSLANPDGSGLSVAVSGFVTAPTGARDIRADGFEGGVLLPVSVPLNTDWSLSLTPEIDWVSDADGEGRHATYTMVAGVGRGFGRWNLGAELWVSRDEDPEAPATQSTFDLTAVWTPASLSDAQIDFGLNFGLNDDSPDVELGFGLARRF